MSRPILAAKKPEVDRRLQVQLGLAALTSVFVLSHAFRTAVTVAAEPLSTEFEMSGQELGVVAAAFHLAFAVAQPVVGVALDRYGPRLTVAVGFVFTLSGSVLSASATNVATLITGQVLVGFGCAPALLAAMVFISRHYPFERFATVSGFVLSLGGAGMLITGTPLAWTMATWSWRTGFFALSFLSLLSWFAVLYLVDQESVSPHTSNQTLANELRGLRSILGQRYTAGICCLAATSYAAFLAVRGLWLGPWLTGRHGLSLIEVGHVAVAVSIAGMVGPLVFGWLDPGDLARRKFIAGCSTAYALLFAVHAFGAGVSLDVLLLTFNGFLAGFITLQYADLRSAFPAEMTGRALSVFTMAMFLGVAGMQWISGLAASAAPGLEVEPLRAALLSVCAVLSLGTLGFWFLPWPPSSTLPLG